MMRRFALLLMVGLLVLTPACKNDGGSKRKKDGAAAGTTTGSGSGSGSGSGPSGPSQQWQVAMAALAAAPSPEPLTLDAAAVDRWNERIAQSWPHLKQNILDLVDAQIQSFVGTAQSGVTVSALSIQAGALDAPPKLVPLPGGPATHPAFKLQAPGEPETWEVTVRTTITYNITVNLFGTPVTVSNAGDFEVALSNLRAEAELALDATDPTLPTLDWIGQPTVTTFDVDVTSTHALAGPVVAFLSPVVEVLARAAVDTLLQDARQQFQGLMGLPGPHLGMGGASPQPLSTAPVDLEALALQVDEVLRRDNLNYGLVSEVEMDDPTWGQGNVARLRGVGDSAIWTGHYLASLAYRYHVAPDAQIEATVEEILDGLTRCLDISHPHDGLLSRTALPVSDPLAQRYVTEPRAYVTSLGGQDWVGLGYISRDQNLGVMFGLGQVVYRMPNQAARAGQLIDRIVTYLDGNEWNAYDYNTQTISAPFAQTPLNILSFLQTATLADPGRWQSERDRWAPIAAVTWLPAWTSLLNVHEQYYKFNLGHTNMVNLLEFETDPARYRHLLKTVRLMRGGLAHHRNGWFDSVYAMAVPTDAAQVAPVIEDSMQRLASRSRRGFSVQNSQDPNVGQVTYQFVFEPGRTETLAEHPIPVDRRRYADFLWQRSPFTLDGNAPPERQSSGVDILLPYWFGRAHGL